MKAVKKGVKRIITRYFFYGILFLVLFLNMKNIKRISNWHSILKYIYDEKFEAIVSIIKNKLEKKWLLVNTSDYLRVVVRVGRKSPFRVRQK